MFFLFGATDNVPIIYSQFALWTPVTVSQNMERVLSVHDVLGFFQWIAAVWYFPEARSDRNRMAWILIVIQSYMKTSLVFCFIVLHHTELFHHNYSRLRSISSKRLLIVVIRISNASIEWNILGWKGSLYIYLPELFKYAQWHPMVL